VASQTESNVPQVKLRSVDGQAMDAQVLGAQDSSVVLQRADKRRFVVPMERFDLDSQKLITEQLLAANEIVSVPEILADYFDPRLDRPELLPGTVYIRNCRSGSKWWARLHIGDFGPKPSEFESIEFSKGVGAKTTIRIPYNCLINGSARGGKTWTAQEFSLTAADFDSFIPLLTGSDKLSATGIDRSGKRIELDAGQLAPFATSLALSARVRAFSKDPAFGNRITSPVTDRSELLFAKARRILNSEPFDLRVLSGEVLSGLRLDRFSEGRVRVIDTTGSLTILDLQDLAPETLAEAISRRLESEYSFRQSAETGLEYFSPFHGTEAEAADWTPHLKLGRQVNGWRPLLWAWVSAPDPAAQTLERLRIFVDDAPGFALTSSDLNYQKANPEGLTYYGTTFHANDLGSTRLDLVRESCRIRFELVSPDKSIWVEATPEQVEQFRNAAINYSLMRSVDESGAPVRPLL